MNKPSGARGMVIEGKTYYWKSHYKLIEIWDGDGKLLLIKELNKFIITGADVAEAIKEFKEK